MCFGIMLGMQWYRISYWNTYGLDSMLILAVDLVLSFFSSCLACNYIEDKTSNTYTEA